MHLKRRAIPKTWPLPKKGTKYVVVPSEKGLPILIAIRDILKLAENKREVKKILNNKNVFVNNRMVRDIKFALKLFDVLKLKDKLYRLTIKNKKFYLENINEKEAETKIAKIIGKKILKGKKIQINLNDGRNYFTKQDFKVGDSVLIDFKEGIKRFIELKEKAKVFVEKGKHIGKIGIIEKINNKLAEIKLDNKEKINVNLDALIALE
ncbi:MAG: 30S ribosomal protein S4e [Candidatus Pacearchaeota archaeon]